MKYALIKDNVVVQIQPNKEKGFVEVGDDVCCGMIKEEGSFLVPDLDNNDEIRIEEINSLLDATIIKLAKNELAYKDSENRESKHAEIMQERAELIAELRDL